jgi:hypothetical protein
MAENARKVSSPFALEKEAVIDEIENGVQSGVEKLGSDGDDEKKQENFHNTKKLLEQYRRVAYAVAISESELNIRMELEHGTKISTLEINAELAGVDLGETRLAGHTRTVIRSKNMLEIITTALNAVRSDPDNGELLYQILYLTYFTSQRPKNRTQIVDQMDKLGFQMSIASYYNYLRAGIQVIDRILWGYTARDCIEIIKQFIPE